MVNTFGSSDPALGPGSPSAQNCPAPPYLVIYWPVLGSSHPTLPEEWREDPFGGFQQPAAGWRQAAQGPAETEQFAARGWLHRALCGLHPSGFCSQSSQSLLWPHPESCVHWIEDFPEEGTGRDPQTVLWSGKMSCWGSGDAEVCPEGMSRSNSGCMVESPTRFDKPHIEGQSQRWTESKSIGAMPKQQCFLKYWF